MGLFSSGRHRSGETSAQSRARKHGQVPHPRKVAQCPCGKGAKLGHAGPCRIPTGTFRNGQSTMGRGRGNGGGTIKPMGRSSRWTS
jgi:hypothetical protein